MSKSLAIMNTKHQKFKTTHLKPSDIQSDWYLVDASQIALGRLATEVAKLLIGKHKINYSPHLNHGDHVIVINAQQCFLTGNKETTKKYYRHSGYLGNLSERTVAQQRALDARQIVYKAVKGMLPKNKLQAVRLDKLRIYSDDNHQQHAQKPTIYKLPQKEKIN